MSLAVAARPIVQDAAQLTWLCQLLQGLSACVHSNLQRLAVGNRDCLGMFLAGLLLGLDHGWCKVISRSLMPSPTSHGSDLAGNSLLCLP